MSRYFKNLFQRRSEETRQRKAEQSREVSKAEKTKKQIDDSAERIENMVKKLKRS